MSYPLAPLRTKTGIMPPYAGPQTDLDQRFVVEAFRIRTVS